MVNNVIGMVNYVIAARPSLLNFVIADTQGSPAPARQFDLPSFTNPASCGQRHSAALRQRTKGAVSPVELGFTG